MTPKIYKREQWFLLSASPLMMLYISMKVDENIINGFQGIERTRFCDRPTDGQMDRQELTLLVMCRSLYVSMRMS